MFINKLDSDKSTSTSSTAFPIELLKSKKSPLLSVTNPTNETEFEPSPFILW